MDKEQAKFILQSFRPDGADAADADFAEALQLAAEDRELGEWLANERAQDAAFAAALSEVEIPDDLRQHILAVMRGEKPTDPAADEAMDKLLRKALDDVQPPAGLRDQIIAAMEMQKGNVTQMKPSPSLKKTRRNGSWFKITAIAATIALGAFVAFQLTPGASADKRLTSHIIQQKASQILDAHLTLDVKNTNPDTINTWLVTRKLPTPASLPTGLRSMKIMGCKEITLPGDKKASLLCFIKDSGGMVHLVIIKNKDVKDYNDLPTLAHVSSKNCYHCPETQWNVARWQDKQYTYILMAEKGSPDKNSILQYF